MRRGWAGRAGGLEAPPPPPASTAATTRHPLPATSRQLRLLPPPLPPPPPPPPPLPPPQITTTVEVEDIRREVQILHHLNNHPHVVQLRDVYEDKHSVHMVLELCQGARRAGLG